MFPEANLARLKAAHFPLDDINTAVDADSVPRSNGAALAASLVAVKPGSLPSNFDVIRRKILDFVAYDVRADPARLEALRTVFPDLTTQWETTYAQLDDVLTRINDVIRNADGHPRADERIQNLQPRLVRLLGVLVREQRFEIKPNTFEVESRDEEIDALVKAWLEANTITVLLDVVHLLKPLLASRRLRLPELTEAMSGFVETAGRWPPHVRQAYFQSVYLREAPESSLLGERPRPAPDDRRAISELVGAYARLCFDVHMNVVKREERGKREHDFYRLKFPLDVRRLYGNALSVDWFEFHLRNDQALLPDIIKLRKLSCLLSLDGFQNQRADRPLPWHWLDRSSFYLWHANPVVENAYTLISLSSRANWSYEGDKDFRISPLFDQLYQRRSHTAYIRSMMQDIVALADDNDLNQETLHARIKSIFRWGGCVIL